MAIRLRSMLFTPGTKPDRFGRARENGADALIIDLEDSVSPNDKPIARRNAFSMSPKAESDPVRVLRINALGSLAGIDDLHSLSKTECIPEIIIIPKVESPVHLALLDRILTELGAATRLIALIESCHGLRALHEIAHSSKRLCALMLGAADLAADLGCEIDAPNITSAKIDVIAAASPSGISCIDSPYFKLNDPDGFFNDVKAAKAIGFTGKAAIHPKQIAHINEVMTPSESDIDRAKKILEINQAGVGIFEGKMIDEAVARQARRVLNAAGMPFTLTSKGVFNG